ncbi:MAG TPA: efflux RND transporter permease subunit [Blastocatellia bacterium]|nr:efflux RND transporter permease subunit [Blastocatellia bacterium]
MRYDIGHCPEIFQNKAPGAEDVKVEAVAGLPQLQIKPDREAIARYGISVEDVNNLLGEVVREESRERLFAVGGLSVLLILIIALVRLTHT